MINKAVIRLLQVLGAGVIIAAFVGVLFAYYLIISSMIRYGGQFIFKLIFGIGILWSLALVGMMLCELWKGIDSIQSTLLNAASFAIALIMLGIAFMPIYLSLEWLLYFSKLMIEMVFNVNLYGIPYILCLIMIGVLAIKFPHVAGRCKDWYVRTYFEPIEKVYSALNGYESERVAEQPRAILLPNTGRETRRIIFYYLIAFIVYVSLMIVFEPPWWKTEDETFEDPPWGYRK